MADSPIKKSTPKWTPKTPRQEEIAKLGRIVVKKHEKALRYLERH